jgi:hypothetical protein
VRMTTACVLKLGVPRSARQPKWMFSGEGSRERVFGTNHIRHFRPLAFFPRKSSRELSIMLLLVNDVSLEYSLDNLVRYLS